MENGSAGQHKLFDPPPRNPRRTGSAGADGREPALLPPIAARGMGAEAIVGAGVPRSMSVDDFEPPKLLPAVKLSAQSLKTMELSKRTTAKKKELNSEKHLQAQIKARRAMA